MRPFCSCCFFGSLRVTHYFAELVVLFSPNSFLIKFHEIYLWPICIGCKDSFLISMWSFHPFHLQAKFNLVDAEKTWKTRHFTGGQPVNTKMHCLIDRRGEGSVYYKCIFSAAAGPGAVNLMRRVLLPTTNKNIQIQ